MSGFTFSHQFSQRWLATPKAVKQTIMHELSDITQLLQPDTELENFRFNVDNLHEHIETLMACEAARREQIAKEQAEKQRLEQERLEQQRLAKQKLEQQQAEQAERAAAQQQQAAFDQEQLEQQRLEQDRRAIEQLKQERQIAKQAFTSPNETLTPPDAFIQSPTSAATQASTSAASQSPTIADGLNNKLENNLENKLESGLENDLDNSLENSLKNELENQIENDLKNNATYRPTAITETPDSPDQPKQPKQPANDTMATEAVYTIAQRDTLDATATEGSAMTFSEADLSLDAVKQQIITVLQSQLDDYLQTIKLDISHWLNEEVERQLAQRLTPQSQNQTSR